MTGQMNGLWLDFALGRSTALKLSAGELFARLRELPQLLMTPGPLAGLQARHAPSATCRRA